MRRKTLLLGVISAILLLPALAGCSEQRQQSAGAVTSLAQLSEAGMKIGVPTGAKSDEVARERFPDTGIVQYRDLGDGFIALKTGKIDGFCFTKNIMQVVVNQNPDLTLLDEVIDKNDLALGARLGDTALIAEINAAIQAFHANGQSAEMEARWLGTDMNPVMPYIEPAANPSKTLVVGIANDEQPMGYLDADGRPTGFDSEYIQRLAKELNFAVDLRPMEFNALIPSLQSGRIDLIIANLNITEERRQSLLFSDVYMTTDIVMMVRKPDDGAQAYFRAGDFAGKSFAIITGSIWDTVLAANIPDARQVHFNSISETVMALKQGKVDATLTGVALAKRFGVIYPDLELLYPPILEADTAFIFGKENLWLRETFNGFLRELHANGVYADMEQRWMNTVDPPDMPDIGGTGENGKLIFATTGTSDVFSFVQNGKPAGFEVEMAYRFARYAGMELEIQLMDFAGIIPAVHAGRADFAGASFAVTEERRQSVDFSDTVYSDGIAVTVRKESGLGAKAPEIFRAEDWAGKKISVLTGTVFDQIIAEWVPGAEPVYFNTVADGIEALKNGRADGIMGDDTVLRLHTAKHPGLVMLEPFVTSDAFGAAVSKEQPELLNQINAFIAQIKADGILDDMMARWLDGEEPPPMPAIPEGSGETLRFGTTDIVDGFSYISHGELTGFDIEFVKRFAAYADRKLEISAVSDHGALIMGVQTGVYDMAASLFTITEERGQSVNFTDPYYIGGSAVAVFDRSSAAQADGNGGFWNSLKTSFERNLLHENRWEMIVEGLRVSIIITLLAFALATLLGFGVCGLRMSGNPLLRAAGQIYITVLRGTPIVVLLMITFYVIFAKSGVSGTMVAVIAFGANGAAFIGEIIRSAILTVDKGQVEAARSMGFSKIGAFFTVTFPQAVRVAFPVYMSEFIALFKMTSVVGYIAVVDLTKAGDIIRSRTYDAFFPLLFVALVYLAAASLMIWLFGTAERMTNKRLRRRAR
ncbi:MAG: ABC transporter permease subunit [Oscillospiraceae bacterium]|nr:ABC transporter permease subunit [Oscillospiraceae bacterium]